MPEPPSPMRELRGRLASFLGTYARDAGAAGYVVGISGGVDSAVAAALAVEGVGPERVVGLLMPHTTSDERDAHDGERVARHLGIRVERIDITPITEAGQRAASVAHDTTAAQNLRPRARMMVLYAHAQTHQRLVLGTSNKSELLTGYFTKWGDGAADVYPLGDVYKTQVWDLARELGLPPDVVTKPPTAGLRAGQTDEDELGIRYADLDRVLVAFEMGHDAATTARRTGVPLEAVRQVAARVTMSAHKRLPLVIPKVGFRTPGLDWREARTEALP